MTDEIKNPCVEMRSADYPTWRSRPCGKPGKVEIDGKWYCGICNPERKKKRRDDQHAKWKAADERIARIRKIAALKEVVVEAALAWHGIGGSVHLVEAKLEAACITLRAAMEDQS